MLQLTSQPELVALPADDFYVCAPSFHFGSFIIPRFWLIFRFSFSQGRTLYTQGENKHPVYVCLRIYTVAENSWHTRYVGFIKLGTKRLHQLVSNFSRVRRSRRVLFVSIWISVRSIWIIYTINTWYAQSDGAHEVFAWPTYSYTWKDVLKNDGNRG